MRAMVFELAGQSTFSRRPQTVILSAIGRKLRDEASARSFSLSILNSLRNRCGRSVVRLIVGRSTYLRSRQRIDVLKPKAFVRVESLWLMSAPK